MIPQIEWFKQIGQKVPMGTTVYIYNEILIRKAPLVKSIKKGRKVSQNRKMVLTPIYQI